MSFGLRRAAAATAGALAVALTLGSATPAFAQTASIDPSTLIDVIRLAAAADQVNDSVAVGGAPHHSVRRQQLRRDHGHLVLPTPTRPTVRGRP